MDHITASCRSQSDQRSPTDPTGLQQRPPPRIGAVLPHGFRSSFRDWAAELTDHPREVIEAAPAHVVQNEVEAAYARSDLFERRRRLMDEWTAYLNRQQRPDDPPRR